MGRVTKRWSRTLAFIAFFLMFITMREVAIPAAAHAATSRDAFEQCLLERANQARTAAGVGKLQMALDLVEEVRDWSERMRFNTFEHMPDSLRQDILPDSWTMWSENIAMNSNRDMPDCDPVHDMWMNSAGHRANLLNSKAKFVAIGTYVDSSGWWATQLFFDADGYGVSCRGTFCDDDRSSFEDAIEHIARAGITQGCNPPTNNRFCPDEPVTRGAMAAFLSRAVELPEGSDISFNDVNGSVFEEPILRLAAAGITTGCNPAPNPKFCPDDYVSRAEMAAFLTRALDLPEADGVDFSDDNGSQFEPNIESLAAAGITTGCNPPANTRFCPSDYVTRGQMAEFLVRALDL
jgi:hypothetical protein